MKLSFPLIIGLDFVSASLTSICLPSSWSASPFNIPNSNNTCVTLSISHLTTADDRCANECCAAYANDHYRSAKKALAGYEGLHYKSRRSVYNLLTGELESLFTLDRLPVHHV